MGPDTVRTLHVWQEGIAVVRDSYALTAGWPKSEMFGLTNQVRRAAVSIPSNLAEGKGRGSRGELVRFARIAPGSTYELDTLLQIATELKFSDDSTIMALQNRLSCLARRISTYIQSHNPRPTTYSPS